ncbi:MAG: hypothetical protein E4H23_02025 [Chrysiogenales bacterium]|nr:MAG: hypothetical protein E4H23_02025 [Chrysiogenales bacterium]
MKGKIDFKKEYKYLFSAAAKEPQKVAVPDFKYLMVDGQGDPNTVPEFPEKIQALYSLAYTVKFMLKQDRRTLGGRQTFFPVLRRRIQGGKRRHRGLPGSAKRDQ